MKIKHTFKGSKGFHGYGYFAFIDGDTNELVIGESWPHEGGEIFRGVYEDATPRTLKTLAKDAPALANAIEEYYITHLLETNVTTLEALRPGMNFKRKNAEDDSRYMLVDMEVSKCFVFGEKLKGFVTALSLENYKIYLFDKSTKIELI